MSIKEIGSQLRALREASELTQEELAGQAKVATRVLQRLEAGQGNPTIGTLEAVSTALEKSLIIYFGNTDEDQLLGLFWKAIPRNRTLILGYARGLIDAHQTEPRSRKASD